MGYADPVRVQQEAANSDLSCLIRFYSGECKSVVNQSLLICCSVEAQFAPLLHPVFGHEGPKENCSVTPLCVCVRVFPLGKVKVEAVAV